ncbi:MAG: hypothetical protein AAFO89_08720 [Planctomycetota bacterium]
MTRTKLTVLVSIAAAGPLIALAPAPQDGQPAAEPIQPVAQDAEKKAETMKLLGGLEGTWRLVQEDGSLSKETSVFKLSSAGAVVREVMMVGEPHEMTNLYHMDGDAVVCTHYCAVGNQPRMVAKKGVEDTDEGPAIDFHVDTVSNYVEGQDHYMGGLKLVFVDADTVHQVWTTFNGEGGVAGQMTFVLKRDADV